jgi:hypothetical protein
MTDDGAQLAQRPKSGDGGFDGCEVEAEIGSGMRDSEIVSNRFAYAVRTLDATRRATP